MTLSQASAALKAEGDACCPYSGWTTETELCISPRDLAIAYSHYRNPHPLMDYISASSSAPVEVMEKPLSSGCNKGQRLILVRSFIARPVTGKEPQCHAVRSVTLLLMFCEKITSAKSHHRDMLYLVNS